MVEDMSDAEIWALRRGGDDIRKIYAAYEAALRHAGQPTVVLAQTIKGSMLGPHFESRNATHQMKKLGREDLQAFRDRLQIPLGDSELDADLPPYVRLEPGSAELDYLHERRRQLGGCLPRRTVPAAPCDCQPTRRTTSCGGAQGGSPWPPRWRSSACSRA
jgi:pyruvate dehydrogenase E1 component